MTSEPDSKGGRRPPTIELKATEVDQPDAAAQSGATAPAEPRHRNPELRHRRSRRRAGAGRG